MQWLPKKNANLLNSNEMGKVAIRVNDFFTVSASVGRMSQLGQKRKLTMKSITEKYIILKEVDKGTSCASVAKKHNIPKQTLSNWLKKKKQIYESVDSNSTRKKRQRSEVFEVLVKPNPSQLRAAIDTLMNYSMIVGTDELQGLTVKVSRIVELEMKSSTKQKQMTDYLLPTV